MSKKLLAAALAAAFLATGGMASAANIDESTATGGDSTGNAVVQVNSGTAGTLERSNNTTTPWAYTVVTSTTLTVAGSSSAGLTLAGNLDADGKPTAGTMTLAVDGASGAVLKIDTATDGKALTLDNRGALITVGDAGKITLDGNLVSRGIISFADVTATSSAVAATATIGNFDNREGLVQFAADSAATGGDRLTMNKLLEAAVKVDGVAANKGKVGTFEITGALGAEFSATNGLTNLSDVTEGTFIFNTLQNSTNAIVLDRTKDIDVVLNATNTVGTATYENAVTANNVLVGKAAASTDDTLLTGKITTGDEGALIVNAGDSTASLGSEWTNVTWNSRVNGSTDASLDKAGVANIIIGDSTVDGAFSRLSFGAGANSIDMDSIDFTDIGVTNFGSLDAKTRNAIVTLGDYNSAEGAGAAGKGIIEHKTTATGNFTTEGGVRTTVANDDMGNIVKSLTAYVDAGNSNATNEIGNLGLIGKVDTAFNLASYNKDGEEVDDGFILLETNQSNAAEINLGKLVEISGTGKFNNVTAENFIFTAAPTGAKDTANEINGAYDTDITLDDTNGAVTTTITSTGSLVGKPANDIAFSGNGNTLINHGDIDLTKSETVEIPPFGPVLFSQDIDFGAGNGNKIINDKTISLGADTEIDGVTGTNGSILNYTKTGNVTTAGTITVDGAFDSNNNGMDDFVAAIQNGLRDGTNTDGEIGNIVVDGTLENDFDLTTDVLSVGGAFKLPKSGVVTVKNQTQANAGGASVTAGPVDVVMDNATNKMFSGAVSGGTVTFTKGLDDSTYTNAITATNGDINIQGGGIYRGSFNTTDVVGGAKRYTRLAAGQTADIGGSDINTHYVGEAGSTTKISGADVNIVNNGSIETGKEASIEYGALTTPNGDQILTQVRGDAASGSTSYITLDPTTKLTVDLDAAREVAAKGSKQQTLFDKTALDSMVDTDLETIMNNSDLITIFDKGIYTSDENGVYYAHTLAELPGDSIDDVLADQGISQYRDMISDTTLESQYLIAGTYATRGAAYNLLSDKDKYLVDTFNIASGYTMDGYSLSVAGNGYNPNEAYAIEQWKNGADWAGAVEAVTDTVRNFNRAITNRAYNIGHLLNQVEYDECGNVINSCGGFKNRIWAGYTGQWDKLEDRGWDKGYKYDAHGFNVGYDHVTSSGVGFGAAFGYSKGDYKNYGSLYNGDKSKIDNYSFGLFASYNHASGFFTTLSGTYTYSKYKMYNGFSDYGLGQGGGYDSAKFHGDSWSVGGKIGYDFKPVANLTITPTVGLYYYSARTNRFDSTFRNGMKYSRHTVEAPIDITAKYDIAIGCDSTLSLMGTAGYAYNFHNKGTKISGFTMGDALDYGFGDHRMTKPGRSSWNVGGGAQFRYKNVDFGVHYEYYGRKDFRSHNLNANVGYSF